MEAKNRQDESVMASGYAVTRGVEPTTNKSVHPSADKRVERKELIWIPKISCIWSQHVELFNLRTDIDLIHDNVRSNFENLINFWIKFWIKFLIFESNF